MTGNCTSRTGFHPSSSVKVSRNTADGGVGQIDAQPLLPPAFGRVEGDAVDQDEDHGRQQKLRYQRVQGGAVQALAHR